MKKTLKVIASTAIAMSAFASVAMADDAASTTSTSTDTSATTAPATKTSADFTDLANVDAGLKAKIDALLKAGVFEGTSATTFGINENMTRAQFAKVLDLIYGVNVDMTVKTSSFSDVTADDQANGWAIPYIEAAKKAGLIDGVTDTTFTPGDNVTLGQFATALVKGLGVKPDMTGTPWYADAVKQAIAKNVLPADTDGSKVATRADLVVGAYGGQQAYQDMNKPAAVSVVSAKATGVQTVVVTLDRDVDTSKTDFTLAKGSVPVNIDHKNIKWSDDKKTATLTLTDTKLSAGDYTVTLTGLDASAIKTATGTFTAQDETVQKIEFVTASDNVAFSKHATVLIKATNQYGENASFSAGSYTVYAGSNNDVYKSLTKTDDGTLKLSLDTTITNSSGSPVYQQNLSVIPVNIYFNDTHVSASKNFTLGVAPFVTKLELGSVAYSNGTAINQKGETATVSLNLYDQYGGLIGWDSFDGTTGAPKASDVQVLFTPYDQNLKYEVGNFNNDGITPQVRVSLLNDVEKSGDYTAQIFYQGASATTKISVKSAAVANKVAIGDLNSVIAAGDVDVYIPVIAYDEAGNQLSLSDLTADKNRDRIQISVSGADAETFPDSNGNQVIKILNSGDHKGTIHLKNVTANAKSVVSVTAYIATANANSTATKTYTVANARTPDHIAVATEPAKDILNGADSSFVLNVIDQYGTSLDHSYVLDSNGNPVTSVSGNTYYYVKMVNQYNANPAGTVGNNTNSLIVTDSDTATTDSTSSLQFNAGTNLVANSTTNYLQNSQFDAVNNTYRLKAISAPVGSNFGFTAELHKVTNAGLSTQTDTVIDSKVRTINVVDPSVDSLSYSINSVPALFNAYDSGVITGSVYGSAGTATSDGSSANQYLGTNDQKNPVTSKFAREVTISATNAAGETVAIPKQITAVTSSNTSVAQVVYNGAGQAFVIGNKAGTASIGVSFKDAKNNIQTLTTPVTVKSDALAVDHITAGNTGVEHYTTDGTNAWDLMDLQVYDNYGVEYEKQDALKYNYLLGVTFSVSNIVGGGTVTVDQYGQFTITGTVTSFDLTATSANGKSATTPIALP